MEIIYVGNEILRKIAEPININEEYDQTIELIEEMLRLVKENDGAGIAAPQVGISKRVILVKNPDTNDFVVMINPQIVWTSFDREYMKEGCLSVLGEDGKPIHKNVFRFTRVRVKYEDIGGQIHEDLVKNHLMARII